MTISLNAIELLKSSSVDSCKLSLPVGQLERELYDEVNEVLTRLGGKWKSRGKNSDGSPKGEHLFPYEIHNLINAVIGTGIMPPKNPTAFFPTPRTIVEMMLQYLEVYKYNNENVRILEPSAGQGGILDLAKEMFPNAFFDAIELLDLNAQVLKGKGYNVIEQDFMTYEPDYNYDLVLMNPPFSLEDDKRAWITHIEKAFSMLKEGGELIAIVPNSIGFASDSRTQKFRDMVEVYGGYELLPAGAFKESGTGVQTSLLWMEKKDVEHLENESVNGYISWYSYNFMLYVDNTRKMGEMMDGLFAELYRNGINEDAIKAFIDNVKSEYRKEMQFIPLTEKGQEQVFHEILRLYKDWIDENNLGGEPERATSKKVEVQEVKRPKEMVPAESVQLCLF